jgi:hypothetical protein
VLATSSSSSGSSSSSTGGGISSGQFWTTTYAVDDSEFEEGYTKLLSATQRLRIRVGGEDHYVGLASLTASQATINVSSRMQQATLSIGSSKNFEVTNDTYYDIYVRLNAISGGKANLTIKKLHELMPLSAFFLWHHLRLRHSLKHFPDTI